MAASHFVDLADDDDAAGRAVFAELQGYFAHSRTWECERMLGSGAYGIALLVQERNARRGYARRVVLKRALDAGADELKTEIAMLKLLRGNAHFATMLASSEDLDEFSRARVGARAARGLRTIFAALRGHRGHRGPGLRTIFSTLRGLRGPALVQEFCPNGTLDYLKDRALKQGLELSNGVLWRFYLCRELAYPAVLFVRACIGFAYPPSGPENVVPTLEEIPPGQAPGDLIHGDIAGRNIVLKNIAIGDEDADAPEHGSIPILKMIDLGSSRYTDNVGKGPEENLHAAAIVFPGDVETNTPRAREDEGPEVRDDVQRRADGGHGHPAGQRGA
ncbi:hypothetical protein EKO27_g8437 [Xylaria grammica]|uniref:Protein kinase domain-containing protein n=1 Tax=Xylaria grammica TaxID=363999 RepID=A0A439CWV3_9PEZI|nr:hypothetical protein EKO27_g8437 [Xylaria grammica]